MTTASSNKNIILDDTEYFTCVCGSYDHTLRFILDLDRDFKDFQLPTIYAEVGLNHYLPWYKRIGIGLRFIFGLEKWNNSYGSWEINADSDDPQRLISMIHRLTDELETARAYREQMRTSPK